MPFTDKDGHLTKAFRKENMKLQVNFQKNTRTETGVVVGKIDKFDSVW